MQPANLQRRVATMQPQGNWPMLRAWLQHDNDSDYDNDYVSIEHSSQYTERITQFRQIDPTKLILHFTIQKQFQFAQIIQLYCSIKSRKIAQKKRELRVQCTNRN